MALVPGGGACKDVVTERGGRAGEAVVREERHDLVQPLRRHAPPRRRVVGGCSRSRSLPLAQARGARARRGDVSGCVAIGVNLEAKREESSSSERTGRDGRGGRQRSQRKERETERIGEREREREREREAHGSQLLRVGCRSCVSAPSAVGHV